MSLLPSVNQGAPGVDYFIRNVSDVPGIPVIDTTTGLVGIEPNSLGQAAIRPAVAANGTLVIGSSSTTFSNLTLTTANTQVGTGLTATAGLAVTGGSAVFTNSIDLNFQQIQNNLRYTQAFNVADGTTDASLGTPQPNMPFGSYAIAVTVTGFPEYNIATTGIWNGTSWSAGGTGYAFVIAGSPTIRVAIRPTPGSGNALVMSNGSGAAVTGFVYYIALGEQ